MNVGCMLHMLLINFQAMLIYSTQISPPKNVYIIRWRFVYGLYMSGHFYRARGHSPSGLSKLKPGVCNPVYHKESHRITCLYDDLL